MAFLLRVALPDRPGSLGQLASALGTIGADIEAIEVVERRLDGSAIDDVLVGLPTGGLPDSLVSACESVPGVDVQWISRFAAGGGLFPDLEAVEVMTHEPRDAAARLTDVLPTVFRADWAALLAVPDATGVLAVEHATPAAPDLSGLPFALRDQWRPPGRSPGQLDRPGRGGPRPRGRDRRPGRGAPGGGWATRRSGVPRFRARAAVPPGITGGLDHGHGCDGCRGDGVGPCAERAGQRNSRLTAG